MRKNPSTLLKVLTIKTVSGVFSHGKLPISAREKKSTSYAVGKKANFRSKISDERFSTRILAEMGAISARILVGNL